MGAYEMLQGFIEQGLVRHTYRAVVYGELAKAGEHFSLEVLSSQLDNTCEAAADSDNEEAVPDDACEREECAVPETLLGDVQGRVLQGCCPLGTSVVELEAGLLAGRCCTMLCHRLRQRGTPVVGDRYAKRSFIASGAKRAEGRTEG